MKTGEKGLGALDVFCLASGAMISSGIFVLPGLAFRDAGPAMILSYFAAGVLALAGVFSIIELATAMPKAGGDYYFLTRSLGPFVGTLSGLLGWFALSLKTAFAVFGLSEMIFLLSGGRIPVFATAAVTTILFTAVNLRGAEAAARMEVILVLALLGLMLLYFLLGLPHVQANRFRPFFPEGTGLKEMFSIAGFVFVSFGGLLKTAAMAEEVRRPGKDLPLGLISATVTITLLYVLLLAVTVGVLPSDQLAGSLAPLSDAARLLYGLPGYLIITTAALLAFITTANAGILSASRYPLALSRDRLLPPFAARVNRRGVPVIAVILTGTIILSALLLDIEKLVKAASAVVITSYILSAIAVVVMRRSRLTNYRPSFRVPFYPWLPVASILAFSFLLYDMGMGAVETGLGLVVLGCLLYLFYGRKHARMDYALLYIIGRAADERLGGRALEKELYDILLRRDRTEGLLSRAELFRYSEFLDIEPEIRETDALIDRLAEQLAVSLDMPTDEVAERFRERLGKGGCAIDDFAAVPHIVVEKPGHFSLLLVRSRNGIPFDGQKAVKAFFVIAGSTDMRELHIKALAAIAETLRAPGFRDRWLAAESSDQIREIIREALSHE